MIGSFSVDGVDSSDFNLVCRSIKRPLLPEMKVARVEPIGLSGAYDYGTDEYALRRITMRIAYIGTSYDELRSRARSIAAWLYSSSWVQLIINDETDKYYLVRVTNDIDLKSLYESGEADIVFDCQPFAISVNAEQKQQSIVTSGSINITHPGTRKINFRSPPGSQFNITILGTFTALTLGLGDETINFTAPMSVEQIVMDNVEMTVIRGTTNIFNTLTGDIDKFFTLQPGLNTLNVSGTGVNATFTINHKPLWL